MMMHCWTLNSCSSSTSLLLLLDSFLPSIPLATVWIFFADLSSSFSHCLSLALLLPIIPLVYFCTTNAAVSLLRSSLASLSLFLPRRARYAISTRRAAVLCHRNTLHARAAFLPICPRTTDCNLSAASLSRFSVLRCCILLLAIFLLHCCCTTVMAASFCMPSTIFQYLVRCTCRRRTACKLAIARSSSRTLHRTRNFRLPTCPRYADCSARRQRMCQRCWRRGFWFARTHRLSRCPLITDWMWTEADR
mmetsp:Transcript_18960/g.62345  ORF Transcript_18960/g.62345 Transcript_18960/m.62345 type:complete len:249 (-) Transcript_18960:3534-4280(-)